MNRKIVILSLFSCLVLFAQAQTPTDWANFGRYEQANEQIRQSPKAVLMGNSITEGWAAKHPEFFAEHQYVGRGISGQTTAQMLARFRADLLDLAPRVAVIAGGTNDIAQNNGYISLAHILDNIISMAELARANGVVPVLCSVLPVADFGWRKGLNPAPKVIELNAMIRAYAQKAKILYVDYHSAMADAQGGMIADYSNDGVHPTEVGYEVMERILPPVVDKALKQARKVQRK